MGGTPMDGYIDGIGNFVSAASSRGNSSSGRKSAGQMAHS